MYSSLLKRLSALARRCHAAQTRTPNVATGTLRRGLERGIRNTTSCDTLRPDASLICRTFHQARADLAHGESCVRTKNGEPTKHPEFDEDDQFGVSSSFYDDVLRNEAAMTATSAPIASTTRTHASSALTQEEIADLSLPRSRWSMINLPDEAHRDPQQLSHAFIHDGTTIFQLSSGLGEFNSTVGVAVIRISGPLAMDVVFQLTDLKKAPKPRYATLCSIFASKRDRKVYPHPSFSKLAPIDVDWAERNGESHDGTNKGALLPIDHRILCLYFPGPNSYTGEDTVEFHVHGNPVVVRNVLRAIGSISRVPRAFETGDGSVRVEWIDAKLRPALAGEFTKRAFMARKLDLTQVEGLNSLLHAKTDRQLQESVRQFSGHIGIAYNRWRKELAECLAYTEVMIDFAENEADVAENEVMRHVTPRVKLVIDQIERHLNDGRRGELLRHGVRTTIAGAPNAGKSTLLNALAKREVAIVSTIPGTTRDAIEITVDLHGWPLIVMDTAGIRDYATASDDVEREGIRRAQAALEKSDLKFVVFDGAKLFTALSYRTRSHPNDTSNEEASLHFTIGGEALPLERLSEAAWTEYFDPTSLKLCDDRTIAIVTKADLFKGVNDFSHVTSSLTRTRPSTIDPIYHSRARREVLEREALAQRNEASAPEALRRGGTDSEWQKKLLALEASEEALKWTQRLQDALKNTVFSSAADVVILSCAADNWNFQALLNAAQTQIECMYRRKGEKQQVSMSIVDPEDPTSEAETSPVANERHRMHLEECLASLKKYFPDPSTGRYTPSHREMVLAAEHLRQAVRSLGRVVGQVDVDELLDVIFNDFCIGK